MSFPFEQPASQAVFSAAGRAVCTIPGPRPGVVWTVNSVSVSTTSLAGTTAKLYKNVEADASLVAGTSKGNLDTAQGGQPVTLYPGEQLLVVWSGGTVGATARAVAFGDADPR